MLLFGRLTDASTRLAAPHPHKSVGVYTRRPKSEARLAAAGAAYASIELEDVCVYACR
jgi:hypothetical protein